jgi:coenzyme F420-reducing hydrogenase delta subunit
MKLIFESETNESTVTVFVDRFNNLNINEAKLSLSEARKFREHINTLVNELEAVEAKKIPFWRRFGL